jgi:hypothetical protein
MRAKVTGGLYGMLAPAAPSCTRSNMNILSTPPLDRGCTVARAMTPAICIAAEHVCSRPQPVTHRINTRMLKWVILRVLRGFDWCRISVPALLGAASLPNLTSVGTQFFAWSAFAVPTVQQRARWHERAGAPCRQPSHMA